MATDTTTTTTTTTPTTAPSPPPPPSEGKPENAVAVPAPVAPVDPATERLYVQRTLAFLDNVFSSYPNTNFRFRLWEGTEWVPPAARPSSPSKHPDQVAFTVVLNGPGSLRRMFLPPTDTRMAMAYTFGDYDLEGDHKQALNLGRHLWESWSWSDIARSAVSLLRLPAAKASDETKHTASLSGSVHSAARDMKAVQFHYDLSNDFYKLWLDKRMVYSCAYFQSRSTSLDDAQAAKLDLVCRKLRLRKGQTVLDVGCGWGAFAMHAAANYGCSVTAISLSEAQVAEAQSRVRAAGLTDLVDVRIQDYRAMQGTFDAVVSIGMVEHVGRENLDEYFSSVFRVLKPGGVFMNHGITLLHDKFASRREVRNGFFAKYIFPDGDLQPLAYVLAAAARQKLEVRDCESLREHYMLTLDHWTERLDGHKDEAVRLVGMETYRLWRLYLIGAAWGFKVGLHTIYQTVLYKADAATEGCAIDHLPLTRDDWYASSDSGSGSGDA